MVDFIAKAGKAFYCRLINDIVKLSGDDQFTQKMVVFYSKSWQRVTLKNKYNVERIEIDEKNRKENRFEWLSLLSTIVVIIEKAKWKLN